MASSPLMTFAEAREMLTEPYACFKLVTATKHITLLPQYIGNFSSGIISQLNSELRFYSNSLDGVLIAFDNVRRLQRTGHLVDHLPHIHLDIQADFIVFQPSIGAILKGIVNKMGKDHIGVLLHQCFNGSIPKPRGMEGGNWPEDGVTLGQEVTFSVTKLYTQSGVASMQGQLTEESLAQIINKKGTKRKADEMAPDSTDTPDTPSTSQPKKKKKKNRDSLSTATDDPILAGSSNQTLDSSMLEVSTADESTNMDVSLGDTSKKKKKKKKKNKDTESTVSVMDKSQDEVDAVVESIHMENSTENLSHIKKKKKKKDQSRVSDMELDTLDCKSPAFSLFHSVTTSTPHGGESEIMSGDTGTSSIKRKKRKKHQESELGESILSPDIVNTPGLVHNASRIPKRERDSSSIGSNDSGLGLVTQGEFSDGDQRKKPKKNKKDKRLKKEDQGVKLECSTIVVDMGVQNMIAKEEVHDSVELVSVIDQGTQNLIVKDEKQGITSSSMTQIENEGLNVESGFVSPSGKRKKLKKLKKMKQEAV